MTISDVQERCKPMTNVTKFRGILDMWPANNGQGGYMWYKYNDGSQIAKKIKGITKAESIEQAKFDGGCGVVTHPKTGERIYWLGKGN